MISQRKTSQIEEEVKMYQKNLKDKRKYRFLLRLRKSNSIYLLVALAFMSSRQAHGKSLEEGVASKQWHEKYSQSNNIKSTDKWTPLKDFNSPVVQSSDTMKTSETLMQPINILSSLSRAKQQQFLNQLAFPSTAANLEQESSKGDLNTLMASCSQLPEEEAQRQCQESYHQLLDLNSRSTHSNLDHHLSLNIQGGFKPSKVFQQQQQKYLGLERGAQQHLDTSASVLNTMKAPNLYHKRSSPFVPSEAIDSSESNSGHSSNNDNNYYYNDSSGADSIGSNFADADESELPQPPAVARNSNNNYHNNNLKFNNNANRHKSFSTKESDDDSDSDSDSASVAAFSASNSYDAALSPAPHARRLPLMRQNQLSAQSSGRRQASSDTNNESNDEDPGAAERNEQEAAEASEAEAADRAALDEQQQAQQEIIKAQAASEAKAIKEQQEALMMQQRLHQQIVLRRQHNLANNQSGDRNRAGREGTRNNPYMHSIDGARSKNMQQNYKEREYNDGDVVDRGEESRPKQLKQSSTDSKEQPTAWRSKYSGKNSLDIQFSDQLDNNGATTSTEQDGQDEVGDYSTRSSSISPPITGTTPEYKSTIVGQQVAKVIEKSNQPNRSDLLQAEQHQYGSHYDSLKGHQDKYYQ